MDPLASLYEIRPQAGKLYAHVRLCVYFISLLLRVRITVFWTTNKNHSCAVSGLQLLLSLVMKDFLSFQKQ